MFRKIVAYYVFIVTLFASEYIFGFLTRTELSKGPYIAIILFIIYLILLFMLLRSFKLSEEIYETVKRKAFYFSFWIGLAWGVMMSFAGGFHYEIDIFELLFMIMGAFTVSGIFGFIGQVISKVLWNKMTKNKFH